MTVSSYLKNIADNAILSESEKKLIQTSVNSMGAKLKSYFGDEIGEHFRFGSYDRGTILPRAMDDFSDVDYMVVFKDNSYKPQTYLDKLRRFVSAQYSRSEISQSHPVIQLELSHIRFELVPAIKVFMYGLQIPKKDGSEDNWLSTDPKDANTSLVEKNGAHDFQIKPLVRLVKYWNACNGYPYQSFELEKMIIGYSFGYLGLIKPKDLKGYFFDFMDSLQPYAVADWKIQAVARAKDIIADVKRLEREGRWAAAETAIKRLIPIRTVTRRSFLG